ncbi:MAG: HGGxSTG domain-containing protein [Rhodoferax sp.]|nr:HGGxSTG domain-containing protein [Rhodoferax sp.]
MTKQPHALPPCGAQTRSGKPCGNTFTLQNGRCRMHGGTSPGAPAGNKRAWKHGIYSNRITPEEEADIAPVDLASLDDVLRLTRVLLSRALADEATAGGAPEVYSVSVNVKTCKGDKTVTRKARSYYSMMLRMIARIERLTILHHAVIERDGPAVEGFEVVP